jgi:Ca-activated chloride channel homolog
MNAFLAHPSWAAFQAEAEKLLAYIHLPKIAFLWPSFLWGLLFVPVAVVVYVLLLRRRKKGVLNYGNLALVKRAIGATGWRRHVPPALMLAALAVLIIGMARPTAEVSLPSTRATVMLAMDVSGSMRASDVNPSRIEAAQAAAKQYIKDQPKDVVIGIVAFASTAFLVQNPTIDHTSLNAAIDRFELQRGTAVGSGILVSLQTLFPQDDFPINNFAAGGFGNGNGGFGFGGGGGYDYSQRFGGRALGDRRGPAPKKEHVPVEPGSYKNAVIILLTDGATNAGFDPIEAARIASNYGVKVYTVGFGTTRGSIVGFGGFQMRAQVDEDALKKIADMTKGRYFHAASSEELKQVYSVLSKQLIMETQQMEITSFFAAAAAVLMLLSAGLSVAWFGRVL